MTLINDTQPSNDRLHEPAKLTPEEVKQVSENIPKLSAWLDASTVPQSDETLHRDRISDEVIVKMLPEILATADQFDTRAKARVAYKDLLSEADAVLSAVAFFADEEFEELAPMLVDGARMFEESQSLGFVAMGRILQLDILNDHPELLRLAAERAREQLWRALMDGTLPPRHMRGEAMPPIE